MLYNEERKSAYLSAKDLSSASKSIVKNLFERLAVHENSYGCDFADMNEEQRSKTVGQVCGLSRKTIYAAESTLRDYVKWCANQGYAAQSSTESIQADVSERIRTSMVCSPADLLHTLDFVFPDPEINGIHYIYRAYFWLAFSGLLETEAIRVEPQHLDYEAMKIRRLYGEFSEYPLYPESLQDIKQAAQMKQICENRGKKGVSLIWKDRAPGALILRGKMNSMTIEQALKSTMRPLISRAFARAREKAEAPADLRSDLAYRRVYMSGIFYREYTAELEGIEPNFSKYAHLDYYARNEKSPYSHGGQYTKEHVVSILRKSYEEDYRRWKDAFRLHVPVRAEV